MDPKLDFGDAKGVVLSSPMPTRLQLGAQHFFYAFFSSIPTEGSTVTFSYQDCKYCFERSFLSAPLTGIQSANHHTPTTWRSFQSGADESGRQGLPGRTREDARDRREAEGSGGLFEEIPSAWPGSAILFRVHRFCRYERSDIFQNTAFILTQKNANPVEYGMVEQREVIVDIISAFSEEDRKRYLGTKGDNVVCLAGILIISISEAEEASMKAKEEEEKKRREEEEKQKREEERKAKALMEESLRPEEVAKVTQLKQFVCFYVV